MYIYIYIHTHTLTYLFIYSSSFVRVLLLLVATVFFFFLPIVILMAMGWWRSLLCVDGLSSRVGLVTFLGGVCLTMLGFVSSFFFLLGLAGPRAFMGFEALLPNRLLLLLYRVVFGAVCVVSH